MIIYKATNIINGKVYIGQTIGKLQSRKIVHESEAKRHKRNHHFHNALNYHGKNNFIWEVIDESETIDELNEKGKKLTEEHRMKMRGRHVFSEETKKTKSILMIGNNYSVDRVKGENNGRAKLTEWDIKIIRRLYNNTQYYHYFLRLSKLFFVSRRNIKKIINYQSWKHII